MPRSLARTAAIRRSPRRRSASPPQQPPVEIAYEERPAKKEEPPATPTKPSAPTTTKYTSPFKVPASFRPPANWRDTYDQLVAFRHRLPPAPVDTIGCASLDYEKASVQTRRFQILVSLMLSSQTKDPVTAAAVAILHDVSNREFGSHEGVTVKTILAMSDHKLDKCIEKVGFHNRKTQYLKQTAQILRDRYDDDIPPTVDELIALPGVGPKMAYLAMQEAWSRNEGIGVDTHVHRISGRLGWVPKVCYEKGPEATRAVLESWLPHEYWPEVNKLLVGMGQLICRPVKPLCGECALKDTCPASTAKTRKKE